MGSARDQFGKVGLGGIGLQAAQNCRSWPEPGRLCRGRAVIPESDDPLPLIEGEPAFLLDEGVAYVRAWTTAQHSVLELQEALAAVGQEGVMPYLRADVNVFGAGV